MKKLLMIAVMAVAAVSANAQGYVGGTVGFSSSKVDGADDAKTTLSIIPEVGYALSDNLSIGIALGYSSEGEAVKTNSFGVAPYARYKFASFGNVDLVCDGKLSYITSKEDVDNAESKDMFGVALQPGLVWNVSDKLAVVAKTTDLLSYYHTKCGDFKQNDFQIGLNTIGLNLGVYFKF